jgi:hypothetical protein
MLGIGRGVLCYGIAEMQTDVADTEADITEEKAGVQLVEITRSSERDGNISVQGLVLRWSSPERKTFTRVGRFSYWGLRKGRKFAEHVREGESEVVDFDWWSGEPEVIEII